MTGRLRVLHVSEVHWGGVVTLLEHFVAEQVRAGHEVHVLAPAEMPPLHAGADVVSWDVHRDRLWTLLKAELELRNLVHDLQPDVVHLHSWLAGALGRPPLPLLDHLPVVYQPHAWSDGLPQHAVARRAVRASERVCARRTTLLVANCEDELARGRALGISVPGRAIGVAVDLARYRPPSAAERSAARAFLGLDDRRLVLVLGRLARQKGQDLLVPVWRDAPPPDATLALVGPGDQQALAELAGAELGRSIVLPGGTNDVRPWLWAADLLVLPSRYETVALVVAEAMATGLPVVATAVDGTAEVLCGGDQAAAGAVVPLGNPAALMREVRRRLDDPMLRARESAAGPVRAQRMFLPGAVVGRLEAAYHDAIHRQRQAVLR